MKSNRNEGGWHFVVIALFLILFIGLSTEVFIFIPWIRHQHHLAILVKLVAYNGVGVFIFINYGLTLYVGRGRNGRVLSGRVEAYAFPMMNLDPGRVKSEWHKQSIPESHAVGGSDV